MAKKKFEAKHFGSILDYVYWRGDIPLANDPWNEVDSLILATIAYENFGENELHIRRSAPLSLRYFWESTDQKRSSLVFKNEFSELRAHLMEALANSIRFRDVLVLDQVNDVDEGRNIQFSAATFSVPGVGIMVSYRGTDSSLVGWKEDCMLSYDTPVPAQLSAIQYLNHIAAAIPGDLYLSGHSKGGNLAVYAASLAPASVQARIRSVCSFDGPGLDSDTIYSDGYSRIKDRLFSVVPSESIVGLLLNYYPNYRVVEATESSIWQHMPFTWKILGKEFLFVDTVSRGAQVLDHSLHEWMKTLSSAQREAVVNTLFCVLGNARNRDNNPAKLSDALATAGLDESSVRMMLSVFYRLMTIHIGNSFGEKIRKPLAMLAGELRMKNLAGHTPVLSSAQIDIDNRGHGFRDIMQEVSNFAEFTGLNHRNAMHLQLLTEEMLTMVRSITGSGMPLFGFSARAISFNCS